MSAPERREPDRAAPTSELRAGRIADILTAVVGLGREVGAGWPPISGRRLSRRHVDVLYVLTHHPGPITPSRLAAVLGVTPGAVTQLVDALQTAGLLTREAHRDDARSCVLRLTPSAQAEITASEQQVVANLTSRFATLTDGQLTSLADLLRRLSP